MHYRTLKLKISCSNSDRNRLRLCNEESAKVWNHCIELNAESFNSNKTILKKNELYSGTKKFITQIICSNNKRTVCNRVYDAFKAIMKARGSRKELNYPYKKKKYYPTEWDNQFMNINYLKNTILLTAVRYVGDDGKKHNGKQIRIWFKFRLPENIKTLKLLYEHGNYYACLSYTVEVKNREVSSDIYSAIDLGEIHSITSIDNHQNQLIITGRKIRSIKQLRNKKQAELRSKMDKCEKFSRRYCKLRIALSKIKSKSRRQLDYHIHKLTRMYTNWVIEKGISLVYCGDVTGIGYNTSSKGSSITRQKINQWEYGKIMSLLEYKLELDGIQFRKVNEAYSSQICPSCSMRNKPKKRNYSCLNCKGSFHRDIVGAWNILNFNHKLNFTPNKTLKYLRIS
ncbi:RNA-guided endonuclease InsQ/TnpB family protein [Paenibacillus sp. NPDC057886]|uniref:RNA-guided endonuclease InsQ/TnpB family protein n=1 Tax=Paenibacillus sp. NPDC057886 TaxID=3346270 RepID=UPI0036CFE9B7